MVRGSLLSSSSEATVLLCQMSMGRRNVVSRSCLDFSVCLARQRRRGLQHKRSYSHFRCTQTSGVLTFQVYSHSLPELSVLPVSIMPGVVSSRLFSHTLRGLVVLAVSSTPSIISLWLVSQALRGLVVLAVSVTPGVVSSRVFTHLLRGLVVLAVSVTPSVVSSWLFSHALRGLIVLGEWWSQRRSRG